MVVVDWERVIEGMSRFVNDDNGFELKPTINVKCLIRNETKLEL